MPPPPPSLIHMFTPNMILLRAKYLQLPNQRVIALGAKRIWAEQRVTFVSPYRLYTFRDRRMSFDQYTENLIYKPNLHQQKKTHTTHNLFVVYNEVLRFAADSSI